jgi:hypothetical protein
MGYLQGEPAPSITHGPAIMTNSPPPIEKPAMSIFSATAIFLMKLSLCVILREATNLSFLKYEMLRGAQHDNPARPLSNKTL